MQQKKSISILLTFCVLTITLFRVTFVRAAQIQDSESATHSADASQYSIVDTHAFEEFKVIQIELPVLSVFSYLLVSNGEALLVDPIRDVDFYLETAKQNNARIKGVYLSHSHADFVAGHMEVVNRLKCPIYQSHKSGVAYKHVPVDEHKTVTIGAATIKFMDTPGHTPDGMCAAVYSPKNPQRPELLFTGDVLFVGSVGRPDLIGGQTSAAWLAGAMFDSWTEKLSKLDDKVLIFPAHGAGSLCGAHLSDDPSSTIGRERVSNPYLKHTAKNEFIAAVLDGLPEAPQYFKHNAEMNKNGPPLVSWDAPLPAEVKPAKTLTDPANYYIVDVRDAKEYAEGHIPNSVNIAARGRLETWVGIMVPWEAKLILTGPPELLKEGFHRLHRIGYRPQILSLERWKEQKLTLTTGNPIAPRELYAMMQDKTAPVIVDVRLPAEWMALRIGTILNLPLNHLAELSSQLDPREPVVVVCNSAYRSSLAVGILERKGFNNVRNLEGGSEAWIASGLPVFEAAKGTRDPAAAVAKKQIRLPERISAESLSRRLLDLPGTFEVVDIRPPQHFSDYNIPGSINADPADIINNPAYLVGVGPLVLVDRDGSVAMAIGGILSQKTEREIKVLYGGLKAYWSRAMGSGIMGDMPSAIISVPAVKPAVAPGFVPGPPKQPQPAAPATKPKRKSAGC